MTGFHARQTAARIARRKAPETVQNARQIEGWAIEEMVQTKTGVLTWGFFESRGAAEQEASRFGMRAVPATLILPAKDPANGG